MGSESRQPRVLVIEENPLVRIYLHRTLTRGGFTMHGTGFRDGLPLLARHPCEGAVVGLDGLGGHAADATVRILRQRGLPVVMYSVLKDPHGIGERHPDVPVFNNCPLRAEEFVATLLEAFLGSAPAEEPAPVDVPRPVRLLPEPAEARSPS